jgi:hypothetical protein
MSPARVLVVKGVAGASPYPASDFPGAPRGPAASLGAFAAARHPAT